MAGSRSQNRDANKTTIWDRARLSVVVPIGIIVVVAIVCIVVAVLTSAQRADEVALDHEKRLLTQSFVDHGQRVLRELESVAGSEQAVRSVRHNQDQAWIQRRIGVWLKTFFDHDFVFVANGSGQLSYALLGRASVNPNAFNTILPELAPIINYVRKPSDSPAHSGLHIASDRQTGVDSANRGAMIQTVLGRPAIVAGVLVVDPAAQDAAAERSEAPIAISVKFIDEDVLAEIGERLQLNNVRKIGENEAPPSGDFAFLLTGDKAQPIAHFAWTPKRPGAKIVRSVIPFIAVALAGFAVLAGFVFGYMRRTAETIAAGEDRLRYLALHDPLCGLPNRNFFGERLERTIKQIRGGAASVAILYVDLDHFKDVNDTLGHPVGDELIRSVTLRLTNRLRSDDIVARLGGDEFAVITPMPNDYSALQQMANRIIAALCAPYMVNGHNIVIGASIGIAVIDGSFNGDASDALRYADMALYRAKNEGRSRACIYDAAMNADLSHRKLLEGDLRIAIETGGLRLLYQPIVNASGETVIGVEALCRWTHPERGEIAPAEFIPIAEHSGLIVALGEWVLRRACQDSLAWPKLFVAVNVSPLQFRRSDFVDVVERNLRETGFDPSRLELELTESTLLGNLESAQAAMNRLRKLGISLALDDFGTGYSSLAYLRRFPFDKLKIDRSFVSSIERGSDAAAIVHAIVSLGRGLGMKVTAEGVETAEQQLFLRAAGVHLMQGYRFGHAMTPEEISTRLATPGVYRSIESQAAATMAG